MTAQIPMEEVDVVLLSKMDKDKWTTISESCSTIESLHGITAEVAGASVLIGIFDLVWGTIQCGKHELVQCRNHEAHTNKAD